MSADKVVLECVRNKKLSGSSRWTLFHVTDDGDSGTTDMCWCIDRQRLYVSTERPLHSSEKVLNIYMRFAENDYLCLKDNYILRKMTEIVLKLLALTVKMCSIYVVA